MGFFFCGLCGLVLLLVWWVQRLRVSNSPNPGPNHRFGAELLFWKFNPGLSAHGNVLDDRTLRQKCNATTHAVVSASSGDTDSSFLTTRKLAKENDGD